MQPEALFRLLFLPLDRKGFSISFEENETMNKEELNNELAEIAKLRKDLQAREDGVRADVIRTIQEMVDSMHIKAHEIRFEGEGKKRTRAAKAPVKYRGPEGQTWTGNGRKPEWVQKVIAEGGNLEDYSV